MSSFFKSSEFKQGITTIGLLSLGLGTAWWVVSETKQPMMSVKPETTAGSAKTDQVLPFCGEVRLNRDSNGEPNPEVNLALCFNATGPSGERLRCIVRLHTLEGLENRVVLSVKHAVDPRNNILVNNADCTPSGS